MGPLPPSHNSVSAPELGELYVDRKIRTVNLLDIINFYKEVTFLEKKHLALLSSGHIPRLDLPSLHICKVGVGYLCNI